MKSLRFKAEGCSKQPNFNFEGNTIGIYCKECAESGKINAKLVGLFITGVVAHLVNKEFGLNKCDKCEMAEVATVPSVVNNELLN